MAGGADPKNRAGVFVCVHIPPRKITPTISCSGIVLGMSRTLLEQHVERMTEQADKVLQNIIRETDGHVWRQVGMTGSEHDECVACGANTSGLGVEASESASKPCEWRLMLRAFGEGPPHVRLVYR